MFIWKAGPGTYNTSDNMLKKINSIKFGSSKRVGL